ncbi:MAG: 1-acyl-sn-glycerol-3-phosphate acyltransferase [Bacteroidales bacterium]|nr:1-acyl-sn-glycerol-3-phosphate acyltransferase [Bacteroidales bacterium]
MKPIWEDDFLYKFCRPYVDLCTRMSYSRLTVNGRENIPSDGVVIFAPNHTNTMMDALVVLQARRGATIFGARADMFKNPRSASFLRWCRIVPLARQRDGMAAVAGNNMVFEEVVDALDHGVPFCMFVEGTHRPMHSLLPVKKGVFRVAALAYETLKKPVYVVPVGIDYGDYFHYMSTARMTYGEPIKYEEGADLVALTCILHDRLASLITYFPDDENYGKNWAEYQRQHTPEFKWWMAPVAILALPVFVVLGIAISPLLLLTVIIGLKIKDKAWMNTVRYCVRLLFTPVIWTLHSAFYLLLGFYRKLFKSISK